MPNHPNSCPNCGAGRRPGVPSDPTLILSLYNCGSQKRNDDPLLISDWCKNTAAAKKQKK